MHSPSVSIFDPVWEQSRDRFSSTGFGLEASKSDLDIRDDTVRSLHQRAELPSVPRRCEAYESAEIVGLVFPLGGERKESIWSGQENPTNSNRKERQFTASKHLLNGANAFEIQLFADLTRPRSAQADEVVMDRGTERAARGCDAV